jgi:thiamine-monophosphate kinase
MSNEFTRIRKLKAIYDRVQSTSIDIGIGDDAAILACAAASKLAWTIDAHVEGVHFRRDLVSWRDEGWRSFIAAASDLAAMGADPWCALSSLTLPRDLDDASLEELASGIAEAARATGANVVGGNLSSSNMVTITTTLIGSCPRATTRDGAKVGDGIWIAGDVGLAAAGLLALEKKIRSSDADAAIAAWRRPTIRLEEARAMRDVAHAAIDVSDGLAQDAAHIAEASGVEMVLDAAMILAAGGDRLAKIAHAVGRDAIDLAMGGGEDYALLVTSDRSIDGFARIGDVIEANAERDRFVSIRRSGNVEAWTVRGFDHFRTRA